MRSQTPHIDESSNQSADNSSRIDWMNILSILWNSKKTIGIVTGTVFLLAIIISFLMTEYYKSTAVILPDADKSKLGSIGSGITDLAALAGVNVGGEGSIVKLYPTILKSESVLKNVILSKYKTKKFADSVNLIQYWEIQEDKPGLDYEIALKALRNELDISIDVKLNVVTMSIMTEEPQFSADILNTIIYATDRFIRTKRNTNASEQRKWIDSRLAEVKEDLSHAENTLKNYREKNRVVSGSPQLLLDQERLLREVQINSTMYVELKKQYELAKIEEIRTTPIINVLDYARPAAKKEKPKKSTIVLVSTILAFAAACGYTVVVKMYRTDIITGYNKFKTMI